LTGASLVALFASCKSDVKEPTDTLSTGKMVISVDETYKPIIEEQLRVFDSSYPNADITVHYKPEAECIKDFMNDSVKLILITRELSANEKTVLENKKVVPTSLAIAKDAMAIIVNNSSADSVLSIDQLKGILTGQYNKKYTVVFDNQGSSTLRYVMDSIIPGEKLGANVFAAKGNDSVIAYIQNNPNAIGFLGVSSVSDYYDPEGLAFIKTVKVVAVLNSKSLKPYRPYQAYIAPNDYPLTRNLYFIHRQTYPGIAVGLANFLSKERGQLIFKQARLFPLRMNIIFRSAEINQ
jgi:phosphate transport system substrate-binding protein